MKYTVKNGHSISEIDPQLLSEWDYDKNTVPPDQISYGSGRKVHWICSKCFSEFEASPNKRHHGRGCPYCAGQKIKRGYNDLATMSPLLAKEWDYEKNNKTPEEVTAKGGGPAFWKCSVCGYEWGPVNISDRYRGTGCPQCKKYYHTSLAEQIAYYYIKKDFSDAVNNYKPEWLGKFSEIDIYIPSLRLAIEYDGEYWHKNKSDQDQKKGILIKKHGIDLIRIREGELPTINDGSHILAASPASAVSEEQDRTIRNLFNLINKMFKLNLAPDIDTIRDYSEIVSTIQSNRREKSLAYLHPELLKDWDYARNGSMQPEQITAGSDLPIHWKCHKCGYLWTAPAYDRHKGHGCAYCAGRALMQGKNDLLSQFPEIAKEWDYKQNGQITPENIAVSDNRSMHWICSKCGYSWSARVADRTGKHQSGCPHCAGKVAVKGEDDFGTLYPWIASDWDGARNDKTPYDYRPGSNQDVFWKCHICGYEWHRPIVDRVRKKTGCKACATKRVGLNKRINNMISQLNKELDGNVDPEIIRNYVSHASGEDIIAMIDDVDSRDKLLGRVTKIWKDVEYWEKIDQTESIYNLSSAH